MRRPQFPITLMRDVRRVPSMRDPETRSARPSSSGFRRTGISSGRCCPSLSKRITTSGESFRLSWMPLMIAKPLPRTLSGSGTTAPALRAASPVPSLEPSATTRTVLTKGFVRSTIEAIEPSRL